jgi:hypothetical protein
MKNLKWYIYGSIAVFFLILLAENRIQSNKIAKQKADIERIEANNFQLMSDAHQQTTLYLTQKEITGQLKRQCDSLAKALKIKPKQIEKIVEVTNTIHDTVRVSVPVTITGKDTWKITDKGDCFIWSADAFKIGDSLKINRTSFEYDNKTTEVFYRERPFRFLFIKYGKWVYKEKIDAKCGNSTEKVFKFIK